MWHVSSRVAVWQPCELLYTCYLLVTNVWIKNTEITRSSWLELIAVQRVRQWPGERRGSTLAAECRQRWRADVPPRPTKTDMTLWGRLLMPVRAALSLPHPLYCVRTCPAPYCNPSQNYLFTCEILSCTNHIWLQWYRVAGSSSSQPLLRNSCINSCVWATTVAVAVVLPEQLSCLIKTISGSPLVII